MQLKSGLSYSKDELSREDKQRLRRATRERRPRRLTKDKRPNVKGKMVLSIRWLVQRTLLSLAIRVR